MINQFNGEEKIFKLIPGDGVSWGFSATAAISSWLDEFAEIMQLQEAKADDVDKKLLFLALKKDNLPFPESDAWELYKQGSAYRIWSHDKIPEIFVELNKEFIDHPEIKFINMWSSLKEIFRYYVDRQGGAIHAALAELDGKGILIAASGGTGKSTCARRLPGYWNSLSDDMGLISKDQKGIYKVNPMPTWSDHLLAREFTTFNTSYSVPLKAVFFLEQSDRDELELLNKTSAIQKIFDSFNQVWTAYLKRLDKNARKRILNNIFQNTCEIAGQIPCYTMRATLSGEFWKEIEKVI